MVRLIAVFVASLVFVSSCFAGSNEPFFPVNNVVRIVSPHGWGQGVLLGQHRILTAAHVVDTEGKRAKFSILDKFGRKLGSATVEKAGQRGNVDLALLTLNLSENAPSVDAITISVCKENAVPGEELEVAADATQYSTHASSDYVEAYKNHEYSTATEAFFSHGTSGAGVYSKAHRCLVGIVSRQDSWGGADIQGCLSDLVKEQPRDKVCKVKFGTEFVAAEDIRKFLAN